MEQTAESERVRARAIHEIRMRIYQHEEESAKSHALGQSIAIETIREEAELKLRMLEANCKMAEHDRDKKKWEEQKAKTDFELSQKKLQLFLNQHPELNN